MTHRTPYVRLDPGEEPDPPCALGLPCECPLCTCACGTQFYWIDDRGYCPWCAWEFLAEHCGLPESATRERVAQYVETL